MSRNVAICVGINAYENSPLAYAVNDAKEVASALSMPEYRFDVIEILDREATRSRIKAELHRVLTSSAGLIIFYFSGHGIKTLKDTPSGTYLVTADAAPFDEGISFDYLQRSVTANCPQGSSFLAILDCCHAGAASLSCVSEPKYLISNDDFKFGLSAMGEGRAVLAACNDSKYAHESPKLSHGLFTKVILDGLLGSAADEKGNITVTSLYGYTAQQMVDKRLQQPVFRGNISGQFLIGSGFQPIERVVLNETDAAKMENEGRSLLEEYQQRLHHASSLAEWKGKKYREACLALEPISRWFDKKLLEHPQLAKRPQFQSLLSELHSRLAYLATIDYNTVITSGVVESKLGSGTFGTVYKIVPLGGKSPNLAYKVYHPQDLSNDAKIARFRRGYRAMKQMDHPYIIKVREMTEAPLGFYMDYIEGSNFRQFAGSLEPSDMLEILMTVADTLRHAHSRKVVHVVHRDVKPENIIMFFDERSGHYRPFLTDFDLAWYTTATRLTKEELGGTLSYASPEQLLKPGSASAHAATTDIYSFGQLCYYAICLSDPAPIGMGNNAQTLGTRLSGWPIEQAAAAFKSLYERCTQPEPAKRFQDFSVVSDTLFQISKTLKDLDLNEKILTERFLRELMFSIIGLMPEKQINEMSFYTVTGKSMITIMLDSDKGRQADVSLVFRVTGDVVIDGVSDRHQLRQVLARRVDAVLREFPGTTRTIGTSGGTYEINLKSRGVPVSLMGVREIRKLVTRMIDVIE